MFLMLEKINCFHRKVKFFASKKVLILFLTSNNIHSPFRSRNLVEEERIYEKWCTERGNSDVFVLEI